jgi:hypothetical protein
MKNPNHVMVRLILTSVTKGRCKYGWKLLRVEKTKDKTLKVNCVFQGETEFANYQSED